MHRTYAENLDFSLEEITINDKTEVHHLRDVLRIRPGDTIKIFNGNGEEADGEIITLSKKEAQIKILNRQKVDHTENIPYIILACAIPKKDKFEWIIEKATELGVAEIFPLKTERTEFHVNAERTKKKNERYKTVAINAAKQCQRLTVPKIHPITSFKDIFDQLSDDTKVFIPCLINDRKSLKLALNNITNNKFMFVIGPEGDFTNKEIESAIQHGAIPVSLGETVLKVETAAIVSVAFAQMFYEKCKQ